MKNTELVKIIKNEVIGVDKVSISKSTNEIVCKRSYFYKMGQTASSFQDKLSSQLEKLGVWSHVQAVATSDMRKSWPKTSWFEVRLRLKAE